SRESTSRVMAKAPEQGRNDTSPRSFKPLIRFGNVTYRIGRLSYGEYEVVRILDDVRLGTFESYPCLTVTSATIHPSFILKIAHAAASAARPSFIERLAHAFRRRNSGIRPKAPGASEAREAERESTADSLEKTSTLQKPRERG